MNPGTKKTNDILSPTNTRLFFLKNLKKNERELKKRLFKSFKINIRKDSVSNFIYPLSARRRSTKKVKSYDQEATINNIKKDILTTLRNKSLKKHRNHTFRVSKRKIFESNKEVLKASNKIPEFHQYFKTNFKNTMSNTKENRRSWVLKTKNVSSKVGKYKINNILSSNSRIKDYINEKRKTLAEYKGTNNTCLVNNYSWRNQHAFQDKMMISKMRKLLKKNNSMKNHKYVSEDDRAKLEKFLLLNNKFFEKKKALMEKKKKKKQKIRKDIMKLNYFNLNVDEDSSNETNKIKTSKKDSEFDLDFTERSKRKELRLKFYKDSK
jgi:hypothetical protein